MVFCLFVFGVLCGFVLVLFIYFGGFLLFLTLGTLCKKKCAQALTWPFHIHPSACHVKQEDDFKAIYFLEKIYSPWKSVKYN